MLGLTLRKEFQGKRLKGTAIELANDKNTGATQIAAAEFLEITYPTADVLKSIEAIGPNHGQTVALIGDRGQGKSHLLAVLHHALTDPSATQQWLAAWATRLNNPKIGIMPLRHGMEVISESLHRQRYKYLWDVLFERHPHGEYARGKWEALGDRKTDVPSDQIILEMLKKQPTALLLDEFQTWYDGLIDTRECPSKAWAFNFIQILSELAKEHPELLVLVVSVRNGDSDAYQQVHRVTPLPVDFKGPHAQRDRRRLLLHRLFENRDQVNPADIEALASTHVAEYLRLAEIPAAECEQKKADFVETWPFAPHLMQLLEDQVLVATSAQETRDLIRILVDLFKTRGDASPVLTAGDFRLDNESSGIAALLDSVANQHHANLREKAQRNLIAVADAVDNCATAVPHLAAIVGALWLRSLSVVKMPGATKRILHIDITGTVPVDDNAFEVEMSHILGNSFNIHEVGDRYIFREEENEQSKLMAYARNDKLFVDGCDHIQLAREVRYVIGGHEDIAKMFRVIVLPQDWTGKPWDSLDPSEKPDGWDDRLPILVVPEAPDKIDERLGRWLKDHLAKRRNTVRFLLPRAGSPNIYTDRDFIVDARAVLKAKEWSMQSPEYTRLHKKYEGELREMIKDRFDRFAVLKNWSFAEPSNCKFHIEGLTTQGSKIPEGIQEAVKDDLFVPEDFAALVIAAAQDNKAVGQLLDELQEPRPNGQECIPWVGEALIKDKISRLCAAGKIAINLRGMEYLQALPGEDQDMAWRRMRGRIGTGKHLDETYVLLPQAVPTAQGVAVSATENGGTSASSDGSFGAATASGSVAGASAQAITTPQSFVGANPTAPSAAPANAAAAPSGSELFGTGPSSSPATLLSAAATSALNLLQKLENWGIGPGNSLQEVTIKVPSATGAQLDKLIRSLPDGMTYELNLKKDGH